VAAEVPKHGVVLLAAGASRRLGRAKQLLEVEGEPLVRRAARWGLATEPLHMVVVLGAAERAVRAALSGLRFDALVCDRWEEGMGRSLKAGLGALDARCAGALIVLCDQLALTPGHLVALRDAWRRSPSGAAASGYGGVVGVPALLPRAWFEDVAEEPGDRGARALLLRNRREVTVVPNERLARDVDVPGDLP
jgi:CTP:molybdopterin cytidylyltransferase MocA